jgi:hypothetical protein
VLFFFLKSQKMSLSPRVTRLEETRRSSSLFSFDLNLTTLKEAKLTKIRVLVVGGDIPHRSTLTHLHQFGTFPTKKDFQDSSYRKCKEVWGGTRVYFEVISLDLSSKKQAHDFLSLHWPDGGEGFSLFFLSMTSFPSFLTSWKVLLMW